MRDAGAEVATLFLDWDITRGFTTVVIAHVMFQVSFVALTVRAPAPAPAACKCAFDFSQKITAVDNELRVEAHDGLARFDLRWGEEIPLQFGDGARHHDLQRWQIGHGRKP